MKLNYLKLLAGVVVTLTALLSAGCSNLFEIGDSEPTLTTGVLSVELSHEFLHGGGEPLLMATLIWANTGSRAACVFESAFPSDTRFSRIPVIRVAETGDRISSARPEGVTPPLGSFPPLLIIGPGSSYRSRLEVGRNYRFPAERTDFVMEHNILIFGCPQLIQRMEDSGRERGLEGVPYFMSEIEPLHFSYSTDGDSNE